MDKISIVVPIYNVEKYLKECIESILIQTYKNLEIILVDDGATDSSGSICDEYKQKDNRIKVIHKKNGGLSDARNAGIEVATGEYISFIDSDDYIANDMYELLYKDIKNEKADISCCSCFLVYKNRIDYGKADYYEVMNSQRAIELLCTMGYMGVSAYAKLYKTELFQNIRYPKGKISEDIYTTYKLFDKANKIIYNSIPKYYYRQRKGSITNNKIINVNALEAAKEQMEFIERKYPEILNAAIKNYIFVAIGVYDNVVKSKKKEKEFKNLKKEMRQEVKKYYCILKKDKRISKSRKIQLFLIRHSAIVYDISFSIYDFIKDKRKIKE